MCSPILSRQEISRVGRSTYQSKHFPSLWVDCNNRPPLISHQALAVCLQVHIQCSGDVFTGGGQAVELTIFQRFTEVIPDINEVVFNPSFSAQSRLPLQFQTGFPFVVTKTIPLA